jgi:hypothetical protein
LNRESIQASMQIGIVFNCFFPNQIVEVLHSLCRPVSPTSPPRKAFVPFYSQTIPRLNPPSPSRARLPACLAYFARPALGLSALRFACPAVCLPCGLPALRFLQGAGCRVQGAGPCGLLQGAGSQGPASKGIVPN